MSEWVLTDDDVYQHVKQINSHTFAACQILPCLNQVAFGVIDLDCYDVNSRDFFEKYLSRMVIATSNHLEQCGVVMRIKSSQNVF